MSLRQIIADEVSALGRSGYAYVEADDVVSARFRRGCAEIEVEFNANYCSDSYPATEVIPAEVVLTALLEQALAVEQL